MSAKWFLTQSRATPQAKVAATKVLLTEALLSLLSWPMQQHKVQTIRGARYLTGENLEVVWAKFSTLS
jgi:hypothetical protein